MAKPVITKTASWATLMATAVDNATLATAFQTEKFDDPLKPAVRGSEIPGKVTKWWADLVDAFLRAIWERLEIVDTTSGFAVTGNISATGGVSCVDVAASGNVSCVDLDASGTVTVGTVSCVDLDASGDVSIQGGTSSTVRLNLGDTDDSAVGGLLYNNSTDELTIRVAGNNTLRLTASALRPSFSETVALGTQSQPFHGLFNSGRLSGGYETLSSGTAIAATSTYVNVDTSGVTVLLPDAGAALGRIVVIENSSTGIITVDSSDASDQIGGSTAGYRIRPGAFVVVQAYAANVWRVWDPRQKLPYIESGAYNSTVNTLVYVPFIGTAETSSIGATNEILAQYSGRVVRFKLFSAENVGTTTIGVHLDGNTTPAESGNVTFTGANQIRTRTFTQTFTAGQRIAFSVDPTSASAGGSYSFSAELEYDLSTDFVA